MQMSQWDGLGQRRHVIVVFSDHVEPLASQLWSDCDAEFLQSDVIQFTDFPSVSEDPDQLFMDIQSTLWKQLKDRDLNASNVTCLGLSPNASAVALTCGVKMRVANVVCLGLSSAAWTAAMESKHAQTQVTVIAAVDSPKRDVNASWLQPELSRLPHCSFVEWKSSSEVDAAAIAKSSKPYWMALLALLSYGTRVQFVGKTEVGFQPMLSKKTSVVQWDSGAGVFELSKVQLNDGNLFVDGVAFFRGRPLPDFSSVSRSLIAESESQRIVMPLGSVKRDSFSDEYAQQTLINYATAGFADPKHSGIKLDQFSPGNYYLSVRVNEYHRVEERPLLFTAPEAANGCWDGIAMSVHPNMLGQVVLDVWKVPVMNPANRFEFQIDQCRAEDDRLFIQGKFAVSGLPMREYKDGKYFLWIRDPSCNQSVTFRLGMMINGNDTFTIGNPGEHVASFFADSHHQGIDVSSVQQGDYVARIVLVTADGVASHDLGELSVCGNRSISIKNKE